MNYLLVQNVHLKIIPEEIVWTTNGNYNLKVDCKFLNINKYLQMIVDIFVSNYKIKHID